MPPGTYFGMLDTAEALAHETAARHISGKEILPAAWRGLTLRRALDDPFDLGRRMLVPSIDTG